MSGIWVLPACIDSVEVPQVFSPTSLSRASECLLAGVLGIGGEGEKRLPPDPRALLGTIFHRLVELAAKGQLDPRSDASASIRSTLNRLMEEEEQQLRKTDLVHYVPLVKTISYAEFLDRRARATAIAKRYDTRVRSIGGARTDSSYAGAEKRISCEALRLTGRVDLLESEGGEIIIRDLKTGGVRTPNGNIAGHIAFQMRLYGLLATRAFPGRRIRLIVDHQESEELSFDSSDVERTNQEREKLLEKLPAGKAKAVQLATVGAHCRWCDVRHLCSAYRTEAPHLWNRPRTDYSLPLDIWGTIAEKPKRNDAGEVSLTLYDNAGRYVAIVALDDRQGSFTEFGSEDGVWFFGLEARGELRNASNQYSHPTNFRELPTMIGERRAYRLRIFRHTP